MNLRVSKTARIIPIMTPIDAKPIARPCRRALLSDFKQLLLIIKINKARSTKFSK